MPACLVLLNLCCCFVVFHLFVILCFFQEISSRGDEMESRLMEALRSKEEAEDSVRSLDDQLEDQRAANKRHESELVSAKESLTLAERRCDDLNAVLIQVQVSCMRSEWPALILSFQSLTIFNLSSFIDSFRHDSY